MGTSSSSLSELRDNKYLQRFSSKESISHNDPFWNQLLSFTFVPPHSREDFLFLEGNITPMLDELLNNNPVTGNVIALTKIFLLHASELEAAVQCENSVFIWQAHNSLFILRCVLKYFIETLGEEGMIKQLEESYTPTNLSSSEPEKLLKDILQALFIILIKIELDDKTYGIILEAVNTLIVLLSVQMFSSRPAHLSIVYSTVMKNHSALPSLLIKNLLQFYCYQKKCPHCINYNNGTSLMSGLASTLWNMFSLSQSQQSKNNAASILSNQSLLLILILINHCSNISEITNPYRSVLFSMKDSKNSVESEVDSSVIKIDFESLFNTLCNTLKDDQNALLVYMLLHQNRHFNHFVLFLSSVEELIIPLLKLLYNAPGENSHLIYMSLIILLILSEEEHFNRKIHAIKLKAIAWYSERFLSEISLGSLTILVLVRTIQFNMTRMHDKYLHTNCLAALANMSACILNLHPYVCQKFVSLIENLGKRCLRIMHQLKSNPGQELESNASSDLIQDLSIIEDVIRMLLEILNSCLTYQFHNNNDLLYTILYKKNIFCMFRSNASFQDVMQNIDAALLFFSEQLESLEHNLSVVEVSEFIKSVSSKWSSEKMKKLPELKFKYVEEGHPEDFFIPYLWSIIFHSSNIHWDSKNILIFNPYKSV